MLTGDYLVLNADLKEKPSLFLKKNGKLAQLD
jgi:hypothetical protein